MAAYLQSYILFGESLNMLLTKSIRVSLFEDTVYILLASVLIKDILQVAQLSQRNRAAGW